ncbi:MFS transporter [Bacillus shivajii]|uniref:MFS transporter n=1 Tax=Bacillus shivajii TaxID=1983719 RepID=UPI001CFB4090|nr:MFS transporter [Bacillus shivajii]UCZ51989.1 MFS transporter [Bacillus shivajii]
MGNLEKSFYSKASMYSFLVVLALFFLMLIGSGSFVKVDLMFVYIVASFIFFIGITVRLTAWLMRPATAEVMKRTIQNMKSKDRQKRNIKSMVITAIENIFLQKFIFKRGIYRGIQHWLIAWGCIGSLGITFGLVFGWVYFKLVDPTTYQIVVFNIPTITLQANGWFAQIVYNGLNITSIMLLIGLIMAIARRINNHDTKVTERAEFDLFPLYVLLAVTVTGLLLTLSYKFLGGWMHSYMALVHQFTVVVFLVYFPFGKLFHLPIRPMAASVPMNYQETPEVDTKSCYGCNELYSNDDQITDVQGILGKQAFDFETEEGKQLSDYCPACRRKIRVMSQLNMKSSFGKHEPEPIQTNNGIHMPGFGRKRSDEFYEEAVKEEK